MDALKRQQKQVATEQLVQPPLTTSTKRKAAAPAPTSHPVATISTTVVTPAILAPPTKKTKVVAPSPLPSTSTSALVPSSSAIPASTSEAAAAEIERKRARKERKMGRDQRRAEKEAKRQAKGKGKAVDVEVAPAPVRPTSSSKVVAEPPLSRLALQLQALERLQKPPKPVKAPKVPVVKKKVVKPKLAAASSSSSVPKVLGAGAVGEDFDYLTAFLKNDPRATVENLPKLVTPADHHALLTSRYIRATDLNKLAKTIGLKFKKGGFSATEDVLINGALATYKQVYGLDEDGILKIVFLKGRKAREEHATFFQEITRALPDRPIIAVYHHLRRMYHPLKGQGPWTKAEDAKLRAGILSVGAKWELLEPIVGRSAFDCRDRFRNHIDGNDGSRKKGMWSLAEEEKLVNTVNEMQQAAEGEIFWSAVAEKLGTRSRSQCRNKWFDMGGVQLKANGKDFTSTDAYILAQKLNSLDVNEESQVVWYELRDKDWCEWSGPQIFAAFSSLKKKLWHYKTLNYKQIVAGLVKTYRKPTETAEPSSPRSKRKAAIKSTPVIEDSDSDEDSYDEEDEDDE